MKYLSSIALSTCLLLCIVISRTNGQSYGNEWIDYNKSYYKITVAQKGIFRLGYEDLVQAGVPIGIIDSKNYQLFRRGVEQAIYVENSGAAQLEPGEFIAFYGEQNDGVLDSLLYNPSSSQPHKYYNLYADTSAYFLTWESGGTDGKRMVLFQEANVDNLPVETSHQEGIIQVLSDNYSLGHTENSYISQSKFDVGEGWTGKRIQEGSSEDFVMSGLSNAVQADGVPSMELLVVGRNSFSDHDFTVFAGTSASTLRELGTYTLSGYNTIKISESLLWSDISASGEMTLKIEVLVNGTEGKSNISLSYLKVGFPQQWNMQGLDQKLFTTSVRAEDKSYVEITETPDNAWMYDVSDPNNVHIIGSLGGLNNFEGIIPATSTVRKLLVTAPDPVVSTPLIRKVDFRNIDPTKAGYIIITHPQLMKSAGASPDAIKAYAEYRASAAGGSYDTLVVSIRDLYNQYSYGEITPLAVYGFMRRMIQQGNPEHLFLIGKALDVKYAYHRSDPSSFNYHDLVPTGGSPGSDAIFTAGIAGSEYEAAIATGRLTASTPDDVINYLNKVKEKEAQPFDNLWQKKLLHLSGGFNAFELVQFEQIVNGFGDIAESIHLGGSVSTITKNSSSTVEFINVSEAVNDGLLFITFFGHSAPGITDIDIGYVTNPALGYSNAGKYPTFIVNGCEAGDFFENYVNWGADWILAPNLGATGFIAHSSFGFVNSLRLYTDTFYRTGFADSLFITKPLGIIQNEAAKRYQALTASGAVHHAQVQQMVLNGDPAVRLFGTNRPDYETTDDNLFAATDDKSPITSTTNEFNVGILARNFGAALEDSLSISLSRTFSDGSVHNYDTLNFGSVYFTDTIYFKVDNDFENNAGLNRFAVTLNANGAIQELDLTNNTAILDLLIPVNGTINLLPVNYAIESGSEVRLVAQASDLLTDTRAFLFELDTTSGFISPFKKSTSLAAKELATWIVTIPQVDSAVYYWRTKYAQPNPGEEDEWEVSSFTFISNGQEGWTQSDPPQFNSANLQGIKLDTIAGKWSFIENETGVKVRTYGSDHPDYSYQDVDVEIDGLNYIFPGRLCRDNTINAIAFNRSTAAPYAALFEEVFNPRTCGRQIQVINNYTDAEVTGTGNYLVNYIDAVKNKDHVILFSIGQVSYSSWTQEIFDKLAEVGISNADIQQLGDGDPVIIYGRKGDAPGNAVFVTANYASTVPAAEQEVLFEEDVPGNFSEGTITSTIIGPAMYWSVLYTKIAEETGTGEYSFDVIGIKDDGSEVLLLPDQPAGLVDITSIDASLYSRLRLRANLADEVNLGVPQLKTWLVIYTHPPEGVLLFLEEKQAVTLQEGQEFSPEFAFLNVSDKSFIDSLEVRYSTFNYNSRTRDEHSIKIEPIPGGDSVRFQVPISTLSKVGLNDLNVLVNPGIQTEQVLANNVIQIFEYLEVEGDGTNPLVEVTVDGEHIFDGDIVSPSPFIFVQIRDANPYLLLEDTTVADVFITRPCEGCIPERISYSDPAVIWAPSKKEKEPFQFEYNPQNLEDGLFLLEVQAKDASGNKAGEQPFQVHFEIIRESTITNFYPYPNPFSTSTRFVFTLTGMDIPDELKIQIMTISGRVVREITQDELGTIRIGNNMTEYAWDGKDEYGDQLANGPYLYRVIARINGQEIKLRESTGDRAFTKGFGKLYLLR